MKRTRKEVERVIAHIMFDIEDFLVLEKLAKEKRLATSTFIRLLAVSGLKEVKKHG